MPKKDAAEGHDRAVRITVDRLPGYRTVYAACKALAPKLTAWLAGKGSAYGLDCV